MYRLNEKDFLLETPGDEEYVSSSEIHRSVVAEFEEIGMPRCVCRKVLVEGPRIHEKIRITAAKILKKTGLKMTEDDYAVAMKEAIASEPGLVSTCCIGLIESTPRFFEPPNKCIVRYIEGQETLLKEKEIPDTERQGNIIIKRIEPELYNPYTFEFESIAELTDEQQAEEDMEIRQLRAESKMVQTIVTVEKYPGMPFIDPQDGFQEESPDLFETIKGKYIVYGIASTGIKGFEVPVIRSTQIFAR